MCKPAARRVGGWLIPLAAAPPRSVTRLLPCAAGLADVQTIVLSRRGRLSKRLEPQFEHRAVVDVEARNRLRYTRRPCRGVPQSQAKASRRAGFRASLFVARAKSLVFRTMFGQALNLLSTKCAGPRGGAARTWAGCRR